MGESIRMSKKTKKDGRLEKIVGLGKSGTNSNAVKLKKRIQKGEL